MASIRPSYHLFASVDSRSSSDPSDRRNGGKNLSYPRRLIANSNAHEAPSEPIAATVAPVTENSSRALVKSRDAQTGHTFGRMSESGIG
ncbi:unnamed protein product [Musa hybrid cultivar]